MFTLAGKQFHLTKVGMARAACPLSLISTPANRARNHAIVITANVNGAGRVERIDYTPSCVVTGGNMRRARLLDAGIPLSWAFVEAGTLPVRTEDEISPAELLTRLDIQLQASAFGSNVVHIQGQPVPQISEVYPLESFYVSQFKGQKFRQAYSLDPVEKRIILEGAAEPLVATPVVGYTGPGAFREVMAPVQTGVRYAHAPSRSGSGQTVSRGAKDSELVTQVFRDWGNLTEAVQMYLNYIRQSNKKPMRPSFYPVSLTDKGQIQEQLTARGDGCFDFAVWSAGAQGAKTKDGLGPSDFAYVGSMNDPSTWHLKIQDASHVRNALSRINQVQGIPASEKGAVLSKVRKLAVRHGVGVSDKPTNGQKKWAKHGSNSVGAGFSSNNRF